MPSRRDVPGTLRYEWSGREGRVRTRWKCVETRSATRFGPVSPPVPRCRAYKTRGQDTLSMSLDYQVCLLHEGQALSFVQ